jgi:alpha-mannosidase
VNEFVSIATQANSSMLGNHIMMTMGSDFQYSNANTWFKNLDKLIHYANIDGRVNVFYSDPVQYTMAKLSQNITWQVVTDDFFPYAGR